MILHHCIQVLDDVLMIEVLDEVDLFLDGLDLLLADRHLLHRHDAPRRQVDPLVDQSVGALADCLDYLEGVDYARLGDDGRGVAVHLISRDYQFEPPALCIQIGGRARQWL